MSHRIKEEGFIQKRRQRSSLLHVWGEEFNQFLAVLAVLKQDEEKDELHQDDMKTRM